MPGLNTPELRPGGASALPGPRAGVSAWDGGKASIFEISRKSNPLIFVFTQAVSDFKMWRERMADHMCRSAHLRRKTLEFTSKLPAPIKKAWLVNSNIEGVNAWDIATMLESFLVDWFPKNMYRRRIPLAGGSMETASKCGVCSTLNFKEAWTQSIMRSQTTAKVSALHRLETPW